MAKWNTRTDRRRVEMVKKWRWCKQVTTASAIVVHNWPSGKMFVGRVRARQHWKAETFGQTRKQN
jgi:hypothetical protein